MGAGGGEAFPNVRCISCFCISYGGACDIRCIPLSSLHLSWQVRFGSKINFWFEISFAKRTSFHWVQLSHLNHRMLQWEMDVIPKTWCHDFHTRIYKNYVCSPGSFVESFLKISYEPEDTSSKLGWKFQKASITNPGCDKRLLQMFECRPENVASIYPDPCRWETQWFSDRKPIIMK